MPEFMIFDNVDGVKAGSTDSVTGEDAGSERALQPGKAESCVAVMTKNELDESVAESADAVVEENWWRHRTHGCRVVGYFGFSGHLLKAT